MYQPHSHWMFDQTLILNWETYKDGHLHVHGLPRSWVSITQDASRVGELLRILRSRVHFFGLAPSSKIGTANCACFAPSFTVLFRVLSPSIHSRFGFKVGSLIVLELCFTFCATHFAYLLKRTNYEIVPFHYGFRIKSDFYDYAQLC